MKKIVMALVISFVFIFILEGCWDAKEIENQNYITAFGVDYKNGSMEVFAQILNFESTAKTEGIVSKAKISVGRGQGTSFIAAMEQISKSSQRREFWGHVYSIVVTENILREGKLAEIIDVVTRHRDMRYSKWVFATRESLADLLSTHTIFDVSNLNSILSNPQDQYEQFSNERILYMNDLIAELNEPNSTVLIPSIQITSKTWQENKKAIPLLELNGHFIMSGYRYKGWINQREARMGRWTYRHFKQSNITIEQDSKPATTLMVKRSDYDIRAKVVQGKLRFALSLSLTGELVQVQQDVPYDKIEKLVGQTVKKEIREFYNRGLELHADLLQLGVFLYKKDPKRWRELSVEGTLPLNPTTLEKIDVHFRIVNGHKYRLRR
ncbi:Ger(x)C family spore germination protein [Brevibacillus fortis]|uniref:Ger(x)C family spore germination protein n=1 Tax=Brevibacillus fortis TaxID=2126352 RepID=UPI002E1F157B|nr:Ger(x)C family spore germination protein [Brevibacillus fortis]